MPSLDDLDPLTADTRLRVASRSTTQSPATPSVDLVALQDPSSRCRLPDLLDNDAPRLTVQLGPVGQRGEAVGRRESVAAWRRELLLATQAVKGEDLPPFWKKYDVTRMSFPLLLMVDSSSLACRPLTVRSLDCSTLACSEVTNARATWSTLPFRMSNRMTPAFCGWTICAWLPSRSNAHCAGSELHLVARQIEPFPLAEPLAWIVP